MPAAIPRAGSPISPTLAPRVSVHHICSNRWLNRYANSTPLFVYHNNVLPHPPAVRSHNELNIALPDATVKDNNEGIACRSPDRILLQTDRLIDGAKTAIERLLPHNAALRRMGSLLRLSTPWYINTSSAHQSVIQITGARILANEKLPDSLSLNDHHSQRE